MAFKNKAVFFGYPVLTLFDFSIAELFDLAAIRANEVIVMIAVIQFEDCLAAVELAANENTGLLELSKNAIHGGQAYVDIFGNQCAINIFSALVTKIGTSKNIQDLQARECRLQAHVF